MHSTKNNKEINKRINKICLGLFTKHINFNIKDNATYKLLIIWKSILFCAFKGLYFESGLEEFTNRTINRIPNADTINRRIKEKTNLEIIKEFMKVQNKLFNKLRKMRLLTKRVIAIIDITEIPYWGDKNDNGVVGTKKQKGTSYCYQYITINIV